jgi:hypothetical protein
MLSDTENLLLQGKVTYKETGKVITWYSNDGTLPPKNAKTGSSLYPSFLETPNTCLQYSI